MSQPASRTVTTAEQLRAMIQAGTFADERLASEPDIAAMLGVSRATVRQALAQLAHEGVLIRKHGRGTFINHNVLHIATRLEEVWDFAEMIRLSGHTPAVRHIETQLGPATPLDQEKLNLETTAETISVTNVFLADRRAVIFCRDVIPGQLVRQAYAPEELHGPVYAFLERRCQQRVSYNITEVLPAVADKTLTRHLDCKTGTPLHYFDEVGYNADHQPILYSQEYYAPDAFRFHVVRKMTSGQPRTTARRARHNRSH